MADRTWVITWADNVSHIVLWELIIIFVFLSILKPQFICIRLDWTTYIEKSTPPRCTESDDTQCWYRHGWCCPQLCRRSTAWPWRRVTASWRIWSLTRPTRFGWWLLTTRAALCPARGSPSRPVSFQCVLLFTFALVIFHFFMVLNVWVRVPPGSTIGACHWYRALHCHVGLGNTVLELK